MKEKIPDTETNLPSCTDENLIENVEEHNVPVDNEGIRIGEVEEISEDAPTLEDSSTATRSTKIKRYGPDTNITELKAMLMYTQTTGCRQLIWDNFFQNQTKCEPYLI